MTETSILILMFSGVILVIGLGFYALGYRDGRKKAGEIINTKFVPMITEAHEVITQQSEIITRQRFILNHQAEMILHQSVTQDNRRETLQ